MHLDQIAAAVHADLASWVREYKGRACVATDPLNVLEILATGPRGLVVIVGYGGGEQLGDQGDPDAALSAETLEVTVGHALGLEVDQGISLLQNRHGRTSLLRLLSLCRARVLSMRFADGGESDTGLAYAGTEAVTLQDGFPLAAYKFKVRLDMAVEVDEPRDVTIE